MHVYMMLVDQAGCAVFLDNELFEIFDDEHNVTGLMEPFHHPGAMV